MTAVPTLRVSEEVALRPLRVGDAARFAEALADPVLRHWMHGVPEGYGVSDARRALAEAAADGDPYWSWAVADRGDRLVGKVALAGDPAGRAASLSYWSHPEGRGRGWTSAAVRAAVGWALSPGGLALSEVRAEVAEANDASRAVLERAGLSPTDARPDYRMGDGRLAPGLRYAARSDGGRSPR